MSASFQENMSNLFLSMSQSSIFPFSDRLPPIVTVCSDIQDGLPLLSLLMLLARLGRFIQSFRLPICICLYYVLRLGRSMIPLYGDGDRTTINFIKAIVECSASPKDTINDICPNG
ncbi:hypothetical protein Tco_0464267 [Tanacetum coccineum]